MLQQLQWLALPCVLVTLTGLILWGLQRDVKPAGAEREIASDDAPPEPSHRPFQHLPSSLLQDRRYLCSVLGPDTPDLILVHWSDAAEERPTSSSYRQLFLPTGDLPAFCEALESEFFEGFEDQGVAERSRLLVAYTFSWLPALGKDLVVESRFVEDRFDHRLYLADSDGKLIRFRRRTSSDEPLHGDDWVRYRGLLLSLRAQPAIDLVEAFEGWSGNPIARASSRAWVGHLGLQLGWAPSRVLREVAHCMEWHPLHLVGRLVRAKARGVELAAVIAGLREQISLHSDREAQTTFLMSQALCTLEQPAAARRLCEMLLMEWPRHPGAASLLRLIDQHERGAQT